LISRWTFPSMGLVADYPNNEGLPAINRVLLGRKIHPKI